MLAAGAAVTLAAACGGSEPVPLQPVATGKPPSYYPAGYASVIEASKKEGGTLTVYSNTDQENWAPILRDFKRKYPWVEKVAANNLDSDEVFQRVLSEQATGNSPADLLVSNAAQAWANFAGRDGTLMEYESPEVSKLPKFGKLLAGVYSMSVDPLAIVYNGSLLEEDLTGLEHLADLATEDADKYRDKITARDVEGSFGFTVSHAFADARPGAWAHLQKLLPMARPETSSGTQLEKITSGEYIAGFFINAAPAYPVIERSGGLLELAFPSEGTVALPRGIGIAAKAPHPATAKLFVDFLLSEEGQRAVAEGGLTSYRDGVQAGDGRHTYQELVGKVGADNVIVTEYTEIPEGDVDAFLSRWNGLLAR
ncbi:ABC transporter substrate-binding protein [Actinomadura algeriensis]|uniref:Iron(III) transport system substrate-binding protein n=1 Tax=Actinomadura algeriensis TaxID=1679523 RepID=A0ABR9K265_9ACTN|nr:extracellular solute-binding protein [Actinomadura algeriensis]MBE1536944.1 iron(III) transport system substrate-binding protein [Actinomadura algeriensis]